MAPAPVLTSIPTAAPAPSSASVIAPASSVSTPHKFTLNSLSSHRTAASATDAQIAAMRGEISRKNTACEMMTLTLANERQARATDATALAALKTKVGALEEQLQVAMRETAALTTQASGRTQEGADLKAQLAVSQQNLATTSECLREETERHGQTDALLVDVRAAMDKLTSTHAQALQDVGSRDTDIARLREELVAATHTAGLARQLEESLSQARDELSTSCTHLEDSKTEAARAKVDLRKKTAALDYATSQLAAAEQARGTRDQSALDLRRLEEELSKTDARLRSTDEDLVATQLKLGEATTALSAAQAEAALAKEELALSKESAPSAADGTASMAPAGDAQSAAAVAVATASLARSDASAARLEKARLELALDAQRAMATDALEEAQTLRAQLADVRVELEAQTKASAAAESSSAQALQDLRDKLALAQQPTEHLAATSAAPADGLVGVVDLPSGADTAALASEESTTDVGSTDARSGAPERVELQPALTRSSVHVGARQPSASAIDLKAFCYPRTSASAARSALGSLPCALSNTPLCLATGGASGDKDLPATGVASGFNTALTDDLRVVMTTLDELYQSAEQ
jgi:chromosome segregation ATPase